MFLTYFINVVDKGVIKVDKGEIVRVYFKHTCVPLLFSVFFQENYPYVFKVNNFGSYRIFGPPDQANLIYFDICHQSR